MRDTVLSPAFGTEVQSLYSWSWHKAGKQNTLPVTRKGCKVAVSWQKPGKCWKCWKVFFLQELLLCIWVMDRAAKCGGTEIYCWGHWAEQSGAQEGDRAFLQLLISDSAQGHLREPVVTLTALRSSSARFVNLGLVVVMWGEPKKGLACVWPACSEVKINIPFSRTEVLN